MVRYSFVGRAREKTLHEGGQVDSLSDRLAAKVQEARRDAELAAESSQAIGWRGRHSEAMTRYGDLRALQGRRAALVEIEQALEAR